MAYLYTPPQWRNYGIFEGSLRYSVPTSWCVYRKAGNWVASQSPGVGDIDSTVDIVIQGPTVIDPSLVTPLTTFNSTLNPTLPAGTTPATITTV